MLRRLALLSFTLLFSIAAFSQTYHFSYTARCRQAYAAYLSLKPATGDALIRQEFAVDPYNLLATYIADYGDFLTLLFNGDPAELKERQGHKDARIDLIDRAPDSEPWKNLAKAGIYMQWALINARMGEQVRAALGFRKSFSLTKDNAARFPKFAPNAVFLGAQEAVAGTIPDDYSWLASLFGMKGNVRSGEAKLTAYVGAQSSAQPLYEEAILFLQYIRFYLSFKQAEVWNTVNNEAAFPAKGNLLRLFVRTNIALNYRKADAALSALHTAQSLPGYTAYPSFDYEMGNALLLKLDPSCTTYFDRYAARNKGKTFTKDALQKTALAYFLQGKSAQAGDALKRVQQSGSAITDADKGAQRFAKEGVWPDATLLQARLLTDGGYSAQALARLKSADLRRLGDAAFATEYFFRLGRAQDETGDAAAAVQSYQRAINLGRDRKEQFSARSALQMALIYERRGQRKEAIDYFHTCLAMRHHDFQSTIDQQAKAGLNRLQNGY